MAIQHVNHGDPTERLARIFRVQQSVSVEGGSVSAQDPNFALFPELSAKDKIMALQYISLSDSTERKARILRVQQSITPVDVDEQIQKPLTKHDLLKGKGLAAGVEVQSSPHKEDWGLKKRCLDTGSMCLNPLTSGDGC